MTETTEPKPGNPRVENFSLQVPPSAHGLEFDMGYNLGTGQPRLGDFILHEGTGRKFRIAERVWIADPNRDANLMLVLEEVV